MVKQYLSFNNNASLDMTGSKYQDELSCSSQTLHIIRSIVDELYQTNNHENSKEKRVRFSLKKETESIKNSLQQEKSPMLSDSTTVVCCLIKGRSKVDCSVSTNDLPSFQCECATQTIDNNDSLMSLLTTDHDQLSITTWTSSKSTIIPLPSSYSIANHSLYSCENSNTVPLLNTAHQLILPSEAKPYDICQEQILENYNINISNSSSKSNEIDENIKFCTCSKRKLSDNDFSNQDKLLEELHLSQRSLQSMHNDGLFYIHDLVIVFLRNISQFNQILLKRYYLSKKQVNLFVKIMNKWWKKQ